MFRERDERGRLLCDTDMDDLAYVARGRAKLARLARRPCTASINSMTEVQFVAHVQAARTHAGSRALASGLAREE